MNTITELFDKIIVDGVEIDLQELEANDGKIQVSQSEENNMVKVEYVLKDKTKIPYQLFSHLKQLKSIILPKDIKYIEDKAFLNSHITSVKSLSNVNYVGNQAFSYTKLSYVENIHNDLLYISPNAFAYAPLSDNFTDKLTTYFPESIVMVPNTNGGYEKKELKDQYLKWSNSNQTITSYNTPLAYIINIKNYPLSYLSSNTYTHTATIDENGLVSILGNGDTTLKATFGGTNAYKSKEISSKLNIVINEPISEDAMFINFGNDTALSLEDEYTSNGLTVYRYGTGSSIDSQWPALFGTNLSDARYFKFRYKTNGATSVAKDGTWSGKMFDLKLPSNGRLRIYATTGSTSDITRSIIVKQSGYELFHQSLKEADAVKVQSEIKDAKNGDYFKYIYPIYEVEVNNVSKDDIVHIGFNANIAIYGFEFVADSSIVDDPDPVELTNEEFGFTSSNITVTSFTNPETPTLNNTYDLPVTYSISGDSVSSSCHIDNEGNLEILKNTKSGKVWTVKATFSGSKRYLPKEVEYSLVVNITPEDISNEELSFSTSNITITTDNKDNFETPTLINTNNYSLTWASSNTSVAIVDSEGNITLGVSNGTTNITASYKGDLGHNAKTITYTILVQLSKQTLTNEEFGYDNGAVTVSSSEYILPTLINIYNLDVIFTSSDTSVATIDNNGNIILTGINGYTQIKATFAGNESYDGKEVSYLINVQKTTLSDSQFGLKSNSSEITLAETTTIAISDIINNEFDLPITIDSSNTRIVSIGENNQITIDTSKNGTSVLTITYDGSGAYAKKSVQYTITVNISNNAAALTGMITFLNAKPATKDNSLSDIEITWPDGTKHSSKTGLNLTYNNVTFETGLKMESSTTPTMTIPSTCHITALIYATEESRASLKLNGTKVDNTPELVTEETQYYTLDLGTINSGTLAITRGGSECALLALIFS